MSSAPREALLAHIERLRETRAPHCIVTVVRTADATSAKAGAKALVTSAGELHGFVGGACVQRSVRNAALEVIASGEPRLIRIRPTDDVHADVDAEGVALYRSSCPSGGSVELFLEPFVARPRLVVCGVSPVALATAAAAASLGFEVVSAVHDGDEWAGCEVAVINTGFDLAALDLDARDAVLVATQGRGDRDALVAALSSPASYVGMVGSRRKIAVLGERIANSVPRQRIAELHGPAGLDIGAIDPEEIALSILAEITAHRRAGRRAAPQATPLAEHRTST